MSAPFRELFVELPRAVFEAMHAQQGTGGAADMSGASHLFKVAYRKPVWRSEWLGGRLAERYGVHSIELLRRADRESVHLVVRFRCGHVLISAIDERTLHTAPAEGLIDVLDAAFDRLERRCYCVTPEAEL